MSTISDRNAPLSPVSVGGSEWSFSRYQAGNDDGSFPNRGNLVSPPNSGGSPGTMSMNGFPPGPTNTGGPSPPPSVGRSSNGMNMYARSEAGGDSSPVTAIDDGILNEHYVALRTFLTARDPNIKHQPNKARDKLLRLSPVQFFELSTDVYDELVRRQAAARIPPNAPNVPPGFLLPEKSFHPKRNQARQRLSSLGPPRFRDLAADVFHELERRFPQFMGSDIPRVGSGMSNRGGPMNRTGTPVNGNDYPPRSQSRMRRPSNASSIRGPPPIDAYGVPPSPSIPNGNYARPMPRHPTQNNTIVPNKSTMLEEDDDGADGSGADEARDNGEANGGPSEADKKLIEDYEAKVKDLSSRLSSMEEAIKKKEEEMSALRDNHQAKDEEKQEWTELRSNLEGKLTEAESLNSSLKQELERMREDHEHETKQLRDQVRQSVSQMSSASVNEDLQRENDELRQSLQQQQQVTEEARAEAQEFLREMRQLSQQSGSTYERQAELEKTVEQLEHEVREWRNRYARTKTQIRSLRGSSAGFSVDGDSTKLPSDNTLLDENGRIRDVHVTKYQMAIDELLQKVRDEHPETVIEGMKAVVVSVRRIMRDLDESAPRGSEAAQQHGKLRTRISATANSLITVSKSFAASSGITPISLVDAAASHLTVAIVDMLRAVKIRPTPTEELDDDNDGTVTPVDSTGFFSPRSTARGSTTQDAMPPVPVFKNLASIRASIESSAYSPVNSPRTSMDAYHAKEATNGHVEEHYDGHIEGLKTYLEDQNTLLITDIQNLVNCVRADGNIRQISTGIDSIKGIVENLVSETQKSGRGNMVVRLGNCRDRLVEAGRRGEELAEAQGQVPDLWKGWLQTVPPIAFEIAREAMDLVETVEELAASSHDADDFS